MTLRTRSSLTSISIYSLIVAVFLTALCSNENNPYKNSTATTVAITGINPDGLDTVSIFTRCTIGVGLTLPSHIDSVHVSAPGNRLWTTGETTFIPGADLANPLPLEVSFSDTGTRLISAIAFIKSQPNCTALAQMRAYSPLNQANIIAGAGDTLTLRTPPVGDQVIYVWDLGNGRQMNTNPSQPYTVRGDEAATGHLFVRDGDSESPVYDFAITQKDITPPSITLLNTQESISGDTIRTGTSPFIFKIRVTDAASSINLVTINGLPFDTMIGNVAEKTAEYLKTISIAGYTTIPYRLEIQVRDAQYNTKTDTFYILFDSTLAPVIDKPTLLIVVPDRDLVTVSNDQLKITGIMNGNYANSTYFLSAQVGDSIYPNPITLSGISTSWDYTVHLKSGTNQVNIRLSTSPAPLTGIVATQSFTVNFNPAAQDTQPPIIADVKTGDQTITDRLITESKTLALRVIAYDLGSGLQQVTINDSITTDSSGSGIFKLTLPLVHQTQGNLISIIATDKAGKTASKTLTVYSNTAPQITVPTAVSFVEVGTPYNGVVQVSDADNDSLTTTIIITHGPISAPKDSTIIPAPNGSFSWTPTAPDTASIVSIAARVSDGLESTEKKYTIAVIQKAVIKDTTRFAIPVAAFPETLQVGRDSLNVTLRFDQSRGTNRGLLSAKVLAPPADTNLLINSLDSVIRWKPQPHDTGLRTLKASITSSSGFVDSLTRIITVLPQIAVSYETMLAGAAESVTPCSVAVALSRSSRDTIRIGYSVNTTTSSADTADYRLLSANPVIFNPGTTRQFIRFDIVNDTMPEPTDTLVLDLVSAPASVKISEPRTCKYAIVNNDTITMPPVDTPAVYFSSRDSSGPRAAYTIVLPVKLTKTALQTASVTISPAGTATLGSDYQLSATQLQFAPGDTQKNVSITVAGGTLSKTDKTILLTLSDLNGIIKLGSNSTYTFTLLKNDTLPPKKKVVLVRGNGNIHWTDQAIVDSLTKLGYSVTQAIEGSLSIDSFAQASAVVISRTTRNTTTGTLLAGMSIPILCANERYLVPFGLATSADTGRSNIKAALVYPSNGVITQYTGVVTLYTNAISTLRTSSTATLLHRVLTHSTDNSISFIWHYDSAATMRNGSKAPARRMAFSMPDPTTYGSSFRGEWWAILKRCLQWNVEGR